MSREPVETTVPAPIEETLEKLRELLPGAFSEGRVDVERLREILGGNVAGPERYSFTWAGKQDAIRLLQVPSRATLEPCPEESVDFESTANLFIEGDNLEVLKLLYRSYFGRVKMIYIDPPYNTGNDFVYQDDFRDPLRRYLEFTSQVDSDGNLLTSNPESAGRFHSSWLSMIYPRLFLARQLLREDGVIFVSIDEHEVHNLRLLMNEIFGEEQFIADIAVVNNLKGRSDRKHIATAHEHLLMYTKAHFESYGLRLSAEKLAKFNETDEHGRRFQWRDLRKRGGADKRVDRPNLYFPLYLNEGTARMSMSPVSDQDVEIHPMLSDGTEGCWRWGRERVEVHLGTLKASQVGNSGRWNVSYRVYLEAEDGQRTSKPKSVWIGSQYSSDLGRRALKKLLPGVDLGSPPKAVGLLREILEQSTRDDDLCLDFFAGSGTMAQALLELNREDGGRRRFILVQLPERLPSPQGRELNTIADIGKERVRFVIEEMRRGSKSGLDLDGAKKTEDLGFRVFKLQPSNYRQWAGVAHQDPGAYTEQMAVFSDPLIDGWKPRDALWEVALKEGFSLSSRVVDVDTPLNQVWQITDEDADRHLLICLDDSIDPTTPDMLGLSENDLFVCRDVALTDELAANLALHCRLKTI